MKFVKPLLLVFFMAFATRLVNAQAKKVTLSGTIININNKMQVRDATEMAGLSLPNDERTFIPDASGNFTVTFSLDKPNYFRIGRNLLYLSPGDKINALLDYNKPMAAVFTGSAVDANNYLRGNFFQHGGSYLNAGQKIQQDIPHTIDTIIALSKVREAELAAVKNITPEFRKYEQARIKADVINSLIMTESYYPYRHKMAKEAMPAFEKELRAATAPVIASYAKDLIDTKNLHLDVFDQIAEDILDKNDKSPQAATIADWLKATDVASKIQHLGSKDEIIAMKPQVDAIVTPVYKAAVTETYNSLVKFGNGDKAVDFTATTAEGKKIKMSDFAGKIIFVDIWATWCGPCLAEMPAMEKLKAKYKDNPNVVFVSLSIDTDQPAWKQKLTSLSPDGLQVIADRSNLNDYSVIDIPRTIVINKDFKIAAMKGNLPSAPQTVKLLDELLTK